MGGRGYGGGGRGRVYTYRYTVTTRMTCIKMGSDVSHFNVSLIVMDRVTRQYPQTTIFEEKGEPKLYCTEVLPLTSLPLGQTGSCRSICQGQTPARLNVLGRQVKNTRVHGKTGWGGVLVRTKKTSCSTPWAKAIFSSNLKEKRKKAKLRLLFTSEWRLIFWKSFEFLPFPLFLSIKSVQGEQLENIMTLHGQFCRLYLFPNSRVTTASELDEHIALLQYGQHFGWASFHINR